MAFRVVGALILSASLAVAACGGSSPESQPAPAAAPATAPAGPRVFFMEPKNGETVKSPVHIVFANEQLTISPVPPGELKEARPGMVHYHLGVDTDCLPAGQPIPKAQPWVHFGMGNNWIDQQLTAGTHKLAVQAGNDLHISGLCETITVTVTE
jgi:Domain of unknown function (DUF4399)